MDKLEQNHTVIDTDFDHSNDVSSGQAGINYDSLLKIKGSDIVSLENYRETKEFIDTEKLYSAISETTPLLSNAFNLLNKALEFTEDARTYLKEGDIVGSDNAILHITTILEELFCCRSIGDNFGTVISAIYHSFANRDQGELLSLFQLNKIHNTLRSLRREPFLNIDRTVDVVMALEDAGFNVNPAYLEEMVGLINE